MMHEIASHAHGEGARQALAKRKLDAIGNVRGACGWANDPKRLKLLKSQLNLTASIAEISRITATEQSAKRLVATRELTEVAPAAIEKLKLAGLDANKITKMEIRAIAFTAFGGVELKDSEAKPSLVEKLTKLMAANPTVIGPAIETAIESAVEQQRQKKQKPAARGADASSSVARRRPRCQEDSSEEDSSEEESEEEADEALEEEVEEDEADEEAGTHARALGDC